MILYEWLYPFIVHIFNIHWSGVLIALFGYCMVGATWNCCHLSASSVYTIQPCTRLQCHFIQSHIGRVYACLAVTCHHHTGQNDRDLYVLLRQRWSGTDTEIRVSTESWHWRRKFCRRSCRDSNPRPFNHESGALTTEPSQPPRHVLLSPFIMKQPTHLFTVSQQ